MLPFPLIPRFTYRSCFCIEIKSGKEPFYETHTLLWRFQYLGLRLYHI